MKKIAVMAGDGIGPDITEQAVKVLRAVEKRFGTAFQYLPVLAGGAAIDVCGEPLPRETVAVCKQCDSVLLGAVGGPKWDVPGAPRPEQALLEIRKELEVFSNLRPAKLFPQLQKASPLKPELLTEGVDILIVRELTGGIYFGASGVSSDGLSAFDTECYSVQEIERVCRRAFSFAEKRRGRLCLVDKANVLESSRLWRRVFHSIEREYPQVETCCMYVDNAAMQLVIRPSQFDVIVTSNLFGAILSDEASMLTGSIGMLASGSLGTGSLGIYEPIHGSAPDIAGQDKANPLAAILSAAMMLRYSFQMEEAADYIENAVDAVLDAGWRTADILQEGCRLAGTRQMGDLVALRI